MENTLERKRNEWHAWAATAIGLMGLVGLASAQSPTSKELALLPKADWSDHTSGQIVEPNASSGVGNEVAPPVSVTSYELQLIRQLFVVHHGSAEGELSVDFFNEEGEVLEHLVWRAHRGEVKSLNLEPFASGRYVVCVSGDGSSQTLRFRKE